VQVLSVAGVRPVPTKRPTVAVDTHGYLSLRMAAERMSAPSWAMGPVTQSDLISREPGTHLAVGLVFGTNAALCARESYTNVHETSTPTLVSLLSAHGSNSRANTQHLAFPEPTPSASRALRPQPQSHQYSSCPIRNMTMPTILELPSGESCANPAVQSNTRNLAEPTRQASFTNSHTPVPFPVQSRFHPFTPS
jgi:hypothetical protein